ncbi:MAG: LysR substrate-binding domain-containing protein, partial [Brevundimonas sp.]
AAFDIDAPRGADVFAASSLHTLVQMIDAGLGVSFLPGMAVRAGLTEGSGVVTRPMSGPGDGPAPRREIVVAWRSGSSRGAAAPLRAAALTLE